MQASCSTNDGWLGFPTHITCSRARCTCAQLFLGCHLQATGDRSTAGGVLVEVLPLRSWSWPCVVFLAPPLGEKEKSNNNNNNRRHA